MLFTSTVPAADRLVDNNAQTSQLVSQTNLFPLCTSEKPRESKVKLQEELPTLLVAQYKPSAPA